MEEKIRQINKEIENYHTLIINIEDEINSDDVMWNTKYVEKEQERINRMYNEIIKLEDEALLYQNYIKEQLRLSRISIVKVNRFNLLIKSITDNQILLQSDHSNEVSVNLTLFKTLHDAVMHGVYTLTDHCIDHEIAQQLINLYYN